MNTQQRFWSKVAKGSDDECWLWTASKRHKGYGAFVWHEGDDIIQGRAHRYAYIQLVGPIPPGMFVLHKCDVPACVNPAHLFLGTNADNVADMCKKGRNRKGTPKAPKSQWRYPRGESHPMATITVETVRQIRVAKQGGASYSQIAKAMGVSQTTAFRVATRKTWSHVE